MRGYQWSRNSVATPSTLPAERKALKKRSVSSEGRGKWQSSKTLRFRKRFPVFKSRTWWRVFVKRHLQSSASERKGCPECFSRPLSLVIARPAWLLSILAFHEPKIADADLYFTFQDPQSEFIIFFHFSQRFLPNTFRVASFLRIAKNYERTILLH